MRARADSATVHCRRPRGTTPSTVPHAPAEALDAFRTDAAHVPGGHAAAVTLPESEAEVAAVLAGTARVLVVGAQSSLTGGATPFGDTVLATTRLAELGTPAGDRIRAGPGVVLATLREALAARGAYYPPLPTYDGATVGGTVATNAAGAATFKYGTTRRWVRALTVVLADGGVLDLERGQATAGPEGQFAVVGLDGRVRRVPVPGYRMPAVPKLAAGYYAAPAMDLVDLFIGAEGTLGVVTSVELAIVTPTPAWFTAFVPLADDAAALALAADLRDAGATTRARHDARGIDVAAVEYLDAASLALLRADGVAGVPEEAGAALLFQLDLDPTTTADQAAAEIANADDATCDTPLTRTCRLLDRHGVLATSVPALPGDETRRAALFALREAVPLAVNRRVAEAQRAIDPTLAKSGGDPIVPVDRLDELLQRTRAILDAAGLDHAVWGHLSDGNVHPNVIPRSAGDGVRAAEAQLAIGTTAIALDGSPCSEHGVGRHPVKQELLRRLYGDAGIAAMRAVKRALDPRGTLAPGVIFPAESV